MARDWGSLLLPIPSLIVDTFQGICFTHMATSSPSVSIIFVYSVSIYCICSVSQSKMVHMQTVAPGARVLVGEKQTAKQVLQGDESCVGWCN